MPLVRQGLSGVREPDGRLRKAPSGAVDACGRWRGCHSSAHGEGGYWHAQQALPERQLYGSQLVFVAADGMVFFYFVHFHLLPPVSCSFYSTLQLSSLPFCQTSSQNINHCTGAYKHNIYTQLVGNQLLPDSQIECRSDNLATDNGEWLLDRLLTQTCCRDVPQARALYV